MNKFSKETLQKFIDAYQEAHGEVLTEGEAEVMLGQLVELYRVLMRPLPKSSAGV